MSKSFIHEALFFTKANCLQPGEDYIAVFHTQAGVLKVKASMKPHEFQGMKADLLIIDDLLEEPTMPKRVTYICSYCGSDDIGIEAHCKWSVEEQRVEVVEMCDKGHTCGRCGNETSLKEVELDE